MKKLKIISIALAVVVIIVSALVWWQFENIKSVYYWFKYDNQNVNEMIDKQNKDVDKYIKDKSNLNVRPSTETEETLHQDKIITDEEFVEVLTGKTDVKELFGKDIELNESKNFVDESGNKLTKEDLGNSKREPQSSTTSKDSSQMASECIARMYVLKSNFETRLSALFEEAKAEYVSIPGKGSRELRLSVLKRYYSRIASLESECDSQVDIVLAELDSILKESGENRAIVEKIRQSYSEEKSLRKAYYLNLLNKS